MSKKNIRQLSLMGIIAALYVVLCLALAPISYVGIQFRVSEILLVLPFYNKKYCVSLILGTFIANIFSPMPLDMLFGTFATVLVCLIIILVKNKIIIAPAAAVINGIIVGIELNYAFGEPLLLSMATVAIGEFVVVLIGVLAFTGIEKVNRKFIDMIKE